ncbi:hypothetical protein J6590_081706 [Homalodisca vitripennis]|nr:hypothetical protein J6590_081706 [Homalodisca vitripennis]
MTCNIFVLNPPSVRSRLFDVEVHRWSFTKTPLDAFLSQQTSSIVYRCKEQITSFLPCTKNNDVLLTAVLAQQVAVALFCRGQFVFIVGYLLKMSDNLRSQSSPIRNILDEVISSEDESNGSDIDVGNIPSDHSLTDFSSGSSEEYVPDYEDLETSDKETPGNEDDISDNGSVVGDRPAGRLNPWLRIYPPEPEKNIRPQF